MKKTVLTLALCLIGTLSFAQAPAIQWQKCLGGTSYDEANCIKSTPDGGYIMVGFAESLNGDVIGSHGGRSDFWVVKLAATGAIEWQNPLGGIGYDYACSIQLTPDGGYIVAGAAGSTNGDIIGNDGGQDAWVVKLSATGAIVWQKTFGGTSYEFANSIQLTPDGGYIMAGKTGSNNGDVTGNHGFSDAWVVKLSATGVIMWQKALGGPYDDWAYSVQPTADGGYIMAGQTYSFHGDVMGNWGWPDSDALVVKLSSTGAIVWQKALGDNGSDAAFSILPTLDGGSILAGYSGYEDGNVTGNHGFIDAWVVKLSATGTIEWQKNLGGINHEEARSIISTPDGGYIVAGFTFSNDGDVTGNHGISDAWVVKLSSTGTLVWEKTIGASGREGANSIQLTPDGGYIVAGLSNSTDGDVTGNHGDYDAWVVKLEPELMATTSFASQELKIFPNPAKNILQLQTATNGSLDKITITDLTGKIVLTQTTNTAQINVEPLASGMYILEATSGENKLSSKFVKE